MKPTLFVFLISFFVATWTTPRQGLAQDIGAPRAKKLDFEDSVVEGINKRPLDSLANIADPDGKRRKNHLYVKRKNFNREIDETLNELRFAR